MPSLAGTGAGRPCTVIPRFPDTQLPPPPRGESRKPIPPPRSRPHGTREPGHTRLSLEQAFPAQRAVARPAPGTLGAPALPVRGAGLRPLQAPRASRMARPPRAGRAVAWCTRRVESGCGAPALHRVPRLRAGRLMAGSPPPGPSPSPSPVRVRVSERRPPGPAAPARVSRRTAPGCTSARGGRPTACTGCRRY